MTNPTNPHTATLASLITDMPTAEAGTPTANALQALQRAGEYLTAEGCNARMTELAKERLNAGMMRALPPAALRILLTARAALVEARTRNPREGKGETPAYFAALTHREEHTMAAVYASGPVKGAHGIAAAAYHDIAAIARFTQPECNEPGTVLKARTHLNALLGQTALTKLPEDQREALQRAADNTLLM